MLLDCSCHGDHIKLRSGDGGEKPGADVEITPTQSTFRKKQSRKKEVSGHLTPSQLLLTRPGRSSQGLRRLWPSCAIPGEAPSPRRVAFGNGGNGGGEGVRHPSYPKLLSP